MDPNFAQFFGNKTYNPQSQQPGSGNGQVNPSGAPDNQPQVTQPDHFQQSGAPQASQTGAMVPPVSSAATSTQPAQSQPTPNTGITPDLAPESSALSAVSTSSAVSSTTPAESAGADSQTATTGSASAVSDNDAPANPMAAPVANPETASRGNRSRRRQTPQRNLTTVEQTFPEFYSSVEEGGAEPVPSNLQPELAEWRRDERDLTPDALVSATGVEATVFTLRDRHVPFLKVELDNGAPVYIPASEAGANYRHLANYVGTTFKIAISRFDEVGQNGFGDTQYIALGSIRQAEFVIAGNLFSQLLHVEDGNDENTADTDPNAEPTKVTVERDDNNAPTRVNVENDETRVGTINGVLEGRYNGGWIFVSYEGMTFPMRANQFYYRSYREPLNEVAHIGQQIRFKITSIERTDFSALRNVQQDREAGRPTPRGMRYDVMITSLPFRENPDAKVRRLWETHSVTMGHVVGYDSVKGILVEVGRGWWIKGDLSARSPWRPTIADADAHTPVRVRIDSLDFGTHNGRCTIMAFPQGTARRR